MNILIPVNMVISLVACVYAFSVARKNKYRRWLRVMGGCLCIYVFFIYLWVFLGVMSQAEIPLFLRWFQGAFVLYIIFEAKNNNA